MKTFISLLALVNGGYMLLDGIFVMVKGKYIGPEKPGPWASLFYKLQIDVFKLGPLFIVFGLAWLCWLYALQSSSSAAYPAGIILSILSLWYLPLGTLFSVLILLT